MKEEASDQPLHPGGLLFGIHDQYRDYYFDGKTFDASFGCLQTDGTIPEHANWAGGHQTYLCATQAPYYVKRNFRQLAEHDIGLDCAYLDVFTCNEPDECANPMHLGEGELRLEGAVDARISAVPDHLDALSYEICKGDAANHAAPQ